MIQLEYSPYKFTKELDQSNFILTGLLSPTDLTLNGYYRYNAPKFLSELSRLFHSDAHSICMLKNISAALQNDEYGVILYLQEHFKYNQADFTKERFKKAYYKALGRDIATEYLQLVIDISNSFKNRLTVGI